MSWKAKALKEGHYTGYLNSKWHQFQGYEICLEELANCIQETLDYAERQEEINEELKAENWKDDRLQEMKKKFDQMLADYCRGFPITEEWEKAIGEWKDQHWTNAHNAPSLLSRLNKQGAIGGAFSYHFVPTSVGTSGVCRCDSCYRKMLRELGDESEYKSYDAYLNEKKKLAKNYDCEFEFQEIG